MKKFAFVALTALAIGLGACTKEEPTPPPPTPKTELQLAVADEANNPQVGAPVELYKTQADFDARTPSARVQGIHYTDGFGKITISSLEPITYWFYVQNADMTKSNTAGTTSKTLTKGVLNVQKVVVK